MATSVIIKAMFITCSTQTEDELTAIKRVYEEDLGQKDCAMERLKKEVEELR